MGAGEITQRHGLRRESRGAPPATRDSAPKQHLPFPLLVDSGQRISEAYHANGLVVKRTVYLIGPDGNILYAKRGKPAAAEVLASAK